MPQNPSHPFTPGACDTRLSPDQTIKLELLVSEWSQSLWIHAPRLTEVATGHVMLDLWGTSWDAQAAWIGGTGLRLDLRRYDRGGMLTVLLDFRAGTYRLGDPGARAFPLIDIRRGIEAASEPARRLYLESLQPSERVSDTGLLDSADGKAIPTAPSAPPILERLRIRLADRFRSKRRPIE